MAGHDWAAAMTADQFTAAITKAVNADDMQAAVDLLHVMAAYHPAQAEVVLNTMNLGIQIARQESST